MGSWLRAGGTSQSTGRLPDSVRPLRTPENSAFLRLCGPSSVNPGTGNGSAMRASPRLPNRCCKHDPTQDRGTDRGATASFQALFEHLLVRPTESATPGTPARNRLVPRKTFLSRSDTSSVFGTSSIVFPTISAFCACRCAVPWSGWVFLVAARWAHGGMLSNLTSRTGEFSKVRRALGKNPTNRRKCMAEPILNVIGLASTIRFVGVIARARVALIVCARTNIRAQR